MSVSEGANDLGFGARQDGDLTELRALVDEIGHRSFEARIGCRTVPERLDRELWGLLEDAGLTSLSCNEDAGPVEIATVLEVLARYAGAVPIAESDLMATWLANRAGRKPSNGPLSIAIADRVHTSNRGLSGTASNVPWARDISAVLLVVEYEQVVRAAIVEGTELEIVDGHNLAGEPRSTVNFEVPANSFGKLDHAVLDELYVRGTWARNIQILGAMQAAFERTVAHCGARVQFGKPLSHLQSVQHSLAAMAGELERSRAAVALAVAAAADFGFGHAATTYATTVARVVLGQTVTEVNTLAHQLHGAIGVTMEHALRLFTLRALSWVTEFGSPRIHAERLGRLALESDDVWALIVDGGGAMELR